MEVKNHLYGRVSDYAKRVGAAFHPGLRPWHVPVDIALPCATQNELDGEDARPWSKTASSVLPKAPTCHRRPMP
jgi:glutamate dehydrogenase/leucine dehydrogenase